jgi:SMC interacting uncharacterized protein involved in chromosome segregation
VDTRVYIQDIHGDEVEVDLLVRDKNHNLVGVYMEGPQAGEEVVLDEYMIETLRETYERIMEEDADFYGISDEDLKTAIDRFREKTLDDLANLGQEFDCEH